MANTIQIKRGNSEPPAGTLLDGELGFDKTNEQLYIGKVDGGNSTTVKIGLKNGVGYNEENQETAVVPLNADTLQGLSASAFAPAGFGLGASSKDISGVDPNTITTYGWYQFAGGHANYPTDMGGYSYMFVASRNSDNVTQFVFVSNNAYSQGLIYKRAKVAGTWYAWECLNPPMDAGVEYRTTERYNGKPVYTKLVNLGVVANQGSYSTGVSGVVIRYVAQLPSAGLTVPYNGMNTAYFGANSAYVCLATDGGIWYSHWIIGSSYSGRFTANIQLWYTKD